ncbi:MAG: hypothetical protein HOW73_15040 [Polyangiaceae bacterium]|nr:hypothetical protein [Polyangiaceae bacterium]
MLSALIFLATSGQTPVAVDPAPRPPLAVAVSEPELHNRTAEEPKIERSRIGAWYGWQILLSNGAADALAAVGFALWKTDRVTSLGFILAGMGGRHFGTLGIHGAHGEWGAGGSSMAVNALATIGGFNASVVAELDRCPDDPHPGLMALGYFGIVSAASAVDAGLYAFERDHGETRVSVVPMGTGAAIVGSF